MAQQVAPSAQIECTPASSACDYAKHSYKAIVAQILMATLALLVTAANGMTSGFPALLLPQLEAENSTIPTTEEEGSWITSIHSIVTPIGSLMSGPIMEHLGRRTTLLVSIFPGIFGWICIALSKSHLALLIGRSLTGMSTGLSAPAALVLLGEMAEPRLRGLLAGAPSASFSMGILLIYALNSSLPWTLVAALSTILPLVALVSLFCLPESPLWLERVNKSDEALKAMTWLRGGSEAQARKELALIKEQQIHNRIIEEAHTSIGGRSRLLSRSVLRALLVVNVFNFFQVMGGTFTIIFYAVSVLRQASGGQVSDTNIAVVTALTRVLLTTIACFLLLKVGRRPLTISSGLGSGTAALILSWWLYWSPDFKGYDWVPSALVVIYVIFNSYGFFTIQALMIGELFPAKARGFSSGVSCAVINAVLFFTSKWYPWMTHVLQPHGLFLLFGLMTFAGTLFAYFFLPETKGRTLAEIEEHFSGSSLFWNNSRQIERRENLIVNGQ
ncbi:facilitated trehalose transporter Tret1-like [Neocloeon triangulifer]|uniref:facilitated trehalose transporter Tret1-like n=1 Tax=Neocloeon triangulifer TaxID=2078957 RepID=UPI00286F459A|nr:facilitated trehalose transporter Tret1-like [Neocloeon triangulifer]XP_059484672.1 facilitated trehalose transporter Tret1-like [Neocloeon triangulifer]